jgi:putative DNA primase/helicase
VFSQDELDRARDVSVREIADKRLRAKLKKKGREWVRPCPHCGGRDRFVILPKNHWHCRRCGKGGDAIRLEMHLSGSSFVDAVRALIGKEAGTTNRRQPTPEEIAARRAKEEQQRREEAAEAARTKASIARILPGIVPVRGTLAERYLSDARRIEVGEIRDILECIDAIGFHPAVYLNEPGHPLHGQLLPAIIAIQTDPVTAAPTGGIARTYLDKDGRKLIGLDGKSLRAKSLGPMGVVRLSQDEDVLDGLHIAEGLETALSTMALGFRPMWAMGSNGTIAAFQVLNGIECLTVFTDHDENSAGEKAARAVEATWLAASKQVRLLRWNEYGDLNDAIARHANEG